MRYDIPRAIHAHNAIADELRRMGASDAEHMAAVLMCECMDTFGGEVKAHVYDDGRVYVPCHNEKPRFTIERGRVSVEKGDTGYTVFVCDFNN